MGTAIVKEIVNKIKRVSTGKCNDKDKWRIVVDEAALIENAGEDPLNRPMHRHISKGIIVIDKPPGPTSHEVVAWIKRILDVSKAGHGGTLELTPLRGWVGLSQSDRRSTRWLGKVD